MPIIIKIWLVISAIAAGMTYASAMIARQRFRERYPEIEMETLSPLERTSSLIRSILLTCCPFIHLLIIGGLLFLFDEIIDRAVERLAQEQKW
jgi:hypothetical protein